MLRILKISALVSVVLLLNAVTTLLFVQNAVPAIAGPQCVSGDVNDDAAVDLSDPLYLLNYLFQGGPEPVACAQVPAGVTASELDFITGKYNGVPDNISGAFFPYQGMGGVGGSFLYTDVMTIPPGKIFVATSFQTVDWENIYTDRFWLGKNYDPTLGYPNGASADWSEPSTWTQLISAGVVPGSESMGADQDRDMQVVYRAGDVLSMIRIKDAGSGQEDNILINGYWLNTE